MADEPNVDELRAKLTEKLGELHRRANHATELMSPLRYWRDPLVRFGIGVAIGFVIAGSRRPAYLPPGAVAVPSGGDGILGSMVRAGLIAATSALVSRALAQPKQVEAKVESA